MDDHEARLKRITMRSWRRGTREMDLILGPFAEAELATMDAGTLDAYERLLEENDQDLYPWITARLSGGTAGPQAHTAMLDRVAAHARGRLREIRGA
ncbi:succinate dehydrogenase assembly factor 2 [Paracoccus sp. MC1862]|uniref:FAD assembly factor SdhE n=1 Tax=Paracoccus sp. MC1862 TaxID=2760307 RepID=UPI0016014EB4|nr:succinate dehydrogenase assembly factor 2 [Paracoccus sp. MC1862]MBB1498502.1 succinate dehydrogenase assembly factor 2 [Paracoccus sp. MC1862]QQO43850.1 succinate dehydrogenase assembly factor 2 [Paracoccus sp. MC1862]